MAYMAGPFVPDDVASWPEVDRADPVYVSDLGRLTWGEAPGEEHAHAHYGH
jgi:hypothetical protein